MVEKFAEQTRRVAQLAEEEARGLGHGYVGTEHLLLGIVRDGGPAAAALAARGATAERVRTEVERLVRHGPGAGAAGKLPWTPRAKQAVEIAMDEARLLRQGAVGPEHLLVGLMRESGGVAVQVLWTLGVLTGPVVESTAIYRDLMRVRLEQLRIVERAVRLVRASTPRKRKMREELLAHLTGIYEQELEGGLDADAAMAEAARRFGGPAELSRELGASVPRGERIGYVIDRQLGWRAPESVERFLVRSVGWLCGLMALIWCAAAVTGWWSVGWDGMWNAIRPVTAVAVVTPLSVFAVEWLYYRVRDSWWGVFGTRRSMTRAAGWAALVAISILLCGAMFAAIADVGRDQARQMTFSFPAAAAGAAIAVAIRARVRGPVEIADTVWASLDVGA